MKPTLYYDGTLLANTFSTSNSDRTGVFFVVYNVFLKLMESSPFPVEVFSQEDRKIDVKKALVSFGFDTVPVVTENEIKQNEKAIFFASFAPPPLSIAENTNIAKYMILYDVTPLALPDIEAPNTFWFNLLEKSLNSYDHYFCISEYTKKDFLRFYPALSENKMPITYLAASSNFYHCTDDNLIKNIKQKYNIPQNKKYICTLQPRKNLIHAVKVFAEFIRQNKADDLIFVLGGGHWNAFIDQLKKEISDLGELQDRIVRTGYIADEDLAPLYSGALCTVYVSLYEGFGLPVLEAMQCGCPVITSSTTSIPEVIGNAGIQVNPYDKVALFNAYKNMYTNEKFRNECSQKGLERAKNFSWDICTNQMLNYIEKTYLTSLEENHKLIKKIHNAKRFSILYKQYEGNSVSLRFIGMPIVRKIRTDNSSTIKFFGIPVRKVMSEGFEIKTKILGIPFGTRPNYQTIDIVLRDFSNSIAQKLRELDEKTSYTQQRLKEKLDNNQMYKYIKEVESKEITLKDELEIVGIIADSWEKK